MTGRLRAHFKPFLIGSLLAALGASAYVIAAVTFSDFTPGTTISSSEMNAKLNALKNAVNNGGAASLAVPTVTFRGDWSNVTTYAVDDAVSFGGTYYYSLTAGNLNNQPDVSSTWAGVPHSAVIKKTLTLAAPGFASLFSINPTGTNTAGGTVHFMIRATDGGAQIATASGTILYLATPNSITCNAPVADQLHLGTVAPGCTPGFFNPGSQPGVSIFDNVVFSAPAAIAVHEVYFTVENLSAATIRLEP